MKKISASYSDTLAFYSFLLCGAVFSGFLNYGKGTFISFVFTCICLIITAFPVFLFMSVKTDFSCVRKYEAFFIIPLIFCCISLFSVYSKSFSEALPTLSQGFGQKWFSVAFIIVSLFAASLCTQKKHSVFISLCLLVLPAIILPLFIGWFSFLGYKAPDVSAFYQSFDTGNRHFTDGLTLGAQIPFIILLPGIKKHKNTRRSFVIALFLFLITLFLESAKHIFYFGADGAQFIVNPTKTIISSVPFLNIRELYVFAFYFSYMIKISLLYISCFVLVKRLCETLSFKSICEKKVGLITLFLISGLYIFSETKAMATLPPLSYDIIFATASSCLIVLGIFANCAANRKKSAPNHR